MALRESGKISDRVTTAAGDYLFMPLYPGVPMAKFDKDIKTQLTVVKTSNVFNSVKTPEEQLSLMTQLGEQLQELHSKNLTHGDLHPGNMLVSRDNNGVHLHLIDFDQSRKIDDQRQLLSPGTVNMAPMIRSPEIANNQVGAPSDIYALGLNYLLILGHKNPFAQDPTFKFIQGEKTKLAESREFEEALIQYAALPPEQKKLNEAQYKIRLLNQMLPVEKINQLWLEATPKLEIGKLETLPDEINGIPINRIVKAFLESMLSQEVENRPTIDEVNAFMKAVQKLIHDHPLQIDNPDPVLNKWDDTTPSELLEKYKDEILQYLPKQEIVTPVANVSSTTKPSSVFSSIYSDMQETYRAGLAVLLVGMKNIDQDINNNKKIGMIGIFFDKSPERVQLENTLKGIANLHDAASSKDPKKDYEKIVVFLNEERDKLVTSKSTDKLKALDSLMTKANNVIVNPQVLKENKEISSSKMSATRRMS